MTGVFLWSAVDGAGAFHAIAPDNLTPASPRSVRVKN
jgi:hypothetical protein